MPGNGATQTAVYGTLPPDALLTIGQAAVILGVCPATLRNWDRQGKLKPLRHPLNGYRLYRPEDLRRALPRPRSDGMAGASEGDAR